MSSGEFCIGGDKERMCVKLALGISATNGSLDGLGWSKQVMSFPVNPQPRAKITEVIRPVKKK